MALAPGRVHVCISLNRAGSDFTLTAVDLLTQLRPLLARRVARLTAGRAPPAPASPGPARLTARQQGVLRLVADGLTDAAIGHRLGCSPRTVDKHLEHIYRRLGVSGRTAAVAAARTRTLTARPPRPSQPRSVRSSMTSPRPIPAIQTSLASAIPCSVGNGVPSRRMPGVLT